MMIRTMNKEQLKQHAPSAFAKHASESTSDRYLFVSTEQVIDSMMELGWRPVSAVERHVRSVDRQGYQKHLIQFESPAVNEIALKGYEVGDLHPRIGVTNSHDLSSPFALNAMLMRTICSNQAVVTEKMFGDFHFKHVISMQQVADGVYEYVKNLPPLGDKIEHYMAVHMTAEARKDFAHQALRLRYDSLKDAPMKYTDLLTVRHDKDNLNTLWNTYNVVQENLLKPETKHAGRKVRSIFGMDSDLNLNTELWNLMIAFASAKK